MSQVSILKVCISILCSVILFSACKPDLSDDAIPYQPFSQITINLNLPEYQSLRANSWTYVDGGVRGIILYRKDQSTFMAYERNCSFQPNEACATVDVHVSNLYMTDPCCNSAFDFATGQPTSGPAWRPLQQYETLLSGSNLTITDLVIN